MEKSYQLTKRNEQWCFDSESALEDFLWNNLQSVFNLIPLSRQYYVNGNICDILAVSQDKELAILELKNAEDRYVIQQVTRYYHELLQEKPFAEKVDYQKPVRLIVISPTLHKDNLTDCLYHKLSFELLQFEVSGDQNLEFWAKSISTRQVYKSQIQAQPREEIKISIPPPLQAFTNQLAKCERYDSDFILAIRKKILSLDSRIKEIKLKSNCFGYGKNPNNIFADFKTKKQTWGAPGPLEIRLSLRLPYSFGKRYRFSRFVLDEKFLWKKQHRQWQEKNKLPLFTMDRQRFGDLSPVDGVHSWLYLVQFIRAELNDYSDEIWGDMDTYFIQYCQDEKLPNPSESYENMLIVLIELAYRFWLEKI